jgi:hypothetical protein
MIEYIYYLQYTYDTARVTQAMLCVTLRWVASDTENISIKTTSIPGLLREKSIATLLVQMKNFFGNGPKFAPNGHYK